MERLRDLGLVLLIPAWIVVYTGVVMALMLVSVVCLILQVFDPDLKE